MIVKVYSIFDTAAKVYLPPFHCPTDATALRAFTDAANSPQHFVGQHPADYTLMKIATFCDSTGTYIALPQFENLGNAQIFVRAKPETQLDLIAS